MQVGHILSFTYDLGSLAYNFAIIACTAFDGTTTVSVRLRRRPPRRAPRGRVFRLVVECLWAAFSILTNTFIVAYIAAAGLWHKWMHR